MSPGFDDDGELLPEGVPSFDDPAYDDLRGLLADARLTDPMPAEVADRLDAALTGLREEETIPLSRRRRRTGARLLGAAAVVLAVVGGGIGLDRVLHDNPSDNDDVAASHSPNAPGQTTGGATAGLFARKPVAPMRTVTFAADAARVLADPPPTLTELRSTTVGGVAPLSGQSQESLPTAPGAAPSRQTGPTPGDTDMRAQDDRLHEAAGTGACRAPKLAGTTAYPILLDGRPAVLVVHRASAGKRLVQAWSCAGNRVLAATIVTG